MDAELIGRIKERMLNKDISIRELARLTGVSAANLSRLLSGLTKNPHPRTLKRIGEALGCSYETLISNSSLDGTVISNSGSISVGLPGGAVQEKTATSPYLKMRQLAVSGSALAPQIKDGDIVFIDADSGFLDGDFVAAEVEGKSAPVIRKAMKGDGENVWLIATNPEWQGERQLKAAKILGVVVARLTRVPRG